MENTNPKSFVFVLMPFHESFNDIYQVGIKAACKDAGAYCERVDEQIFVENILERVYNQIAKADVIVAEMTGRNPNVFYEVGYAHALNKQVILLTQNSDDIPFDLKHYPHIVYGGKIAVLKSQLEARIRWCIENPKQLLSRVDLDLEFFVNGAMLVDKPIISITEEEMWLPINLDVHNPTNRMVSSGSFNLALITPPILKADKNQHRIRSVTQQSNKFYINNLTNPSTMFPNSWDNLFFYLSINKEYLTTDPFQVTLRLFTEVGIKDYPFLIVINYV